MPPDPTARHEPGGDDAVRSHKDRLWQAVQWMDRHGNDEAGASVVDEACQRFDLTPADAELLLDMWRERAKKRGRADSD